ncbi:protein shortage in chiasmata 1 ortholog isoform X2 [Takifugu flavidus]|uniref:protein shortage in chiasmata 1 ortholog isoform X2 n=1 Tax=Takifugu flavidus TaxID=433684 RepID=UPI0025444142|nr:protein shortage in chiasmata 1 ortholog isoform X2 [Takifugu flavidus]
MSGNGSSFPAHIFAANHFKALDYAFEKTTRVQVIMDLMSLPAPYSTGTSNLYPHDGKLPEDTYRTPWIRGNVTSSCKLLVSGSVLEDLGDRIQGNSPERFDASLSGDAEVTPSSNSGLLKDLDQKEYVCLVKGSQFDSCQESFLRWTPEQIKPNNDNEEFLLPKDLMIVDYLPQFKRHLPTLRLKLSRLQTLPVSDPLLRSTDGTLDSAFRNLESYEHLPDVKISYTQMCRHIQEKFGKESPAAEESLLLPTMLDTVDLSQAYYTSFSSIRGLLTVVPEQLDGQPPVLDVLNEDVTASVEISQYETQEESVKWNIHLSEMAGHAMLPTELELDLTLSPETRLTQISLSTCKLQMEELSQCCRPTLLSAKTQTEMEAGLWNAEKHLCPVVGFLLAEPHVCKSDVCLQSMSEVFQALKMERQSLTCAGEDMQVFLCNTCEFTEKMGSEVPTATHRRVEDFEKLPLEDFEVTEKIYLKKQESASFRAEAAPDETHLQGETFTNTSPNPPANPSKSSENQIFPKLPAKTKVMDISAPETNTRGKGGTKWREYSLGQVASPRLDIRDDHRGVLVNRYLPEETLDHLSTFMMLRAEQAVPVEPVQKTVNIPAFASQPNQRTPDLQPSLRQTHKSGDGLKYTTGAVSESVTREQNSVCHSTGEVSSQHVQSVIQYSRDVQATDSQKRAYWELLEFAEPLLKSARQLGLDLPVRGDFSCLDPDQTHFLLKQQENVFCRAHAQSEALVTDQEALFNLAALIHALVMFKELLLNCTLSAALEYLTQAAEACAQQHLQQLLKRLQIILLLSNKNPETNFKLLELQHQLSTWLHSRKGQDATARVIVLISVDCDNSRSRIITSLSQVTGGAVTAVSPGEGKKKLNGASLVSCMQDTVCAVACEQHIGPDFPWNRFSLVVEYDRPGQSPWAAICKEKGISHFTFNTVLSDSEEEKILWCLEDNVPYVLFVTEGLLSCPHLLQTLESGFNITVVERRHCPTLQMLGGTHRYAVLTVDESSCIVIQEEDELCQQRASEVMVMRLSALSLQYSCCWLILNCPDSQGGGLSTPAFSNLALVYSSLEQFSNRNLEDLNVKVLIAWGVTDIARWISRICFFTLMSTEKDPLDFLDRDWLSVIPSEVLCPDIHVVEIIFSVHYESVPPLFIFQDEKRLLTFPCINPLVGQLMLKRAPTFRWLLGASLSQLQELLPEVPQKVLKLFSDTTSMFTSPCSEPAQPQMYGTEENIQHSSWTDSCGPELKDLSTEPEAVIVPHSEQLCTDQSSHFFFGDDNTDFRLDLSSFFVGPDDPLQRDWTSSDPWQEENRRRGGDSKKLTGWKGRAGTLGGVVQRVQAKPESPARLDSTFSCSPVVQQSVNRYMSVYSAAHFSDSQNICSILHPPPDFLLWSPSRNCSTSSFASTKYGTKCCLGQERKRSGEAAVSTPRKRGRLSYERVPGRSDGQTRLKLF